jgi:hypothetical protein
MTAAGEESGANATTDYEQTGGYGERQQGGASADRTGFGKKRMTWSRIGRAIGDTAGMHDAGNGADDEQRQGAHPA